MRTGDSTDHLTNLIYMLLGNNVDCCDAPACMRKKSGLFWLLTPFISLLHYLYLLQGKQDAESHISILPGLCRYRDAPEPDLIGHSVTCRATAEDIQKLHDDGDATWTPAFAELIRVSS